MSNTNENTTEKHKVWMRVTDSDLKIMNDLINKKVHNNRTELIKGAVQHSKDKQNKK